MIYNHSERAKKTARGILSLCLLCLTPFITACLDHEDEQLESDTVPLTFYLQTAGGQQTRAYIGDVSGETDESTIHSVKVWLFDESNCISYSKTIDATNKVTMNIPQSYIGKSIDVYIIANPASVGLGAEEGEGALNASTPLNTLTSTVFKENFTAANPVEAVPNSGLPMSRIVKGCPITLAEGGIKAKLPDIMITRAVSKIRFAFARNEASQGSIVGITIRKNYIPKNEYVFPVDPAVYSTTDNYPDYNGIYIGDYRANIKKTSVDADDYEQVPMVFGTNAVGSGITSTLIDYDNTNNNGIPVLDDPNTITWGSWSESEAANTATNKAQAYNDLMNTYTRKTVYIRESDKKLCCEIYYRPTPSSDVKMAEFYMDNASQVQDFARNHIWIVYGYFLGDKFNLRIETIPWDDSYINIDYTQVVSWKEGGEPKWTPTPTTTTEKYNGTYYTIVHTNGGETPSMSFTLDSPEGWQWVAVLEPLTDGANNFISFSDGSYMATGSVGQTSVLDFKIATTPTSVTHRVRLRLLVRTLSGDQSLEVQKAKIIISRSI